MNMTDFNPFVRYMDKRSGFFTGKFKSKAYDYRLFYIIKGNAGLNVENKLYNLKQNDIAIVEPGREYICEYEESVKIFVINMDLCFENISAEPITPDVTNKFNTSKILSKTLCGLFPVHFRCDENACSIMEKVFNLYVEKPEFYHDRMAALVKTLVLDAMAYTAKDNTPKLIAEVKRYLEENCNFDITNKDIGEAFSYHPNYINRMFKNFTGGTIHSYLAETRLKKALRMILETDLQIMEIGEACGFSSYAYFIKSFREKYGVSPLKYRERFGLTK